MHTPPGELRYANVIVVATIWFFCVASRDTSLCVTFISTKQTVNKQIRLNTGRIPKKQKIMEAHQAPRSILHPHPISHGNYTRQRGQAPDPLNHKAAASLSTGVQAPVVIRTRFLESAARRGAGKERRCARLQRCSPRRTVSHRIRANLRGRETNLSEPETRKSLLLEGDSAGILFTSAFCALYYWIHLNLLKVVISWHPG